jgi:hypothetical protein
MKLLIISALIAGACACDIIEGETIRGTTPLYGTWTYEFIGTGKEVHLHMSRTSHYESLPQHVSSGEAKMCLMSNWSDVCSGDRTFPNLVVKTIYAQRYAVGVLGDRGTYEYSLTYCPAGKCVNICPNECLGLGKCHYDTHHCFCENGSLNKDCNQNKPKSFPWWGYAIIGIVVFIALGVLCWLCNREWRNPVGYVSVDTRSGGTSYGSVEVQKPTYVIIVAREDFAAQ